jgi:glycosyltransferase involved in cell wall biosynthesis
METKENKASLYLNMIIGSFEEPIIVKRAIDSVKDYVDGMYLTVTYKDKEPDANNPLVKLLKKYKANVSFFKWTKNFAEARNFALSKVPKGSDKYIFWLDSDDILQSAEKLREALNMLVSVNGSAMYFDYWYQVELDKDGNIRQVLVEHKRERLIRNDDSWKWIGALHETLIEQRQENVLKVFNRKFNDIRVVHLTDSKRFDVNIERNIEILEAQAEKENHKDPRTLIYLAKAYYDKAKMTKDKVERKIKLDLALTLFHEYLAGSGNPGETDYQMPSGWAEERGTAWGFVAEIAVLTGHPDVAISAYQNAIDEAPEFPNYYIDMAMCYVMLEDYKKAEHWLNIGTNVPEPETTIVVYPRELRTRALETSFQINIHKNKLEWALQDAEKLCEIMPDDEFAKKRLTTVRSLVDYNKVCQSFVFIGKYLEAIKESEKIAQLVEAIPRDMRVEKFAAEMRHLFSPAKTWKDNEIAILCGPGFEQWGPESIETGIGGSEEAVIYLSKELTKLGWRVTVYANPKTPGIYDEVEYRIWHDLNPKDEFNVLVLWRSIGFIDVNPKAKVVWLWNHDVPNNPDFTEERLSKIDKVLALSEYHKSLFRMQKKDGTFVKIPDNKFFLTSNGVPDLKTKEWKGNPHRMIYASSYDRGLIYLLQMWPKIKEKVNDAELYIFYGWNLFDKVHFNNPGMMDWKNRVLTLARQSGIIEHGRVGHEELEKEFKKSAIWAYPTDFTEISCITAMKAQQAGAIPVVTDYAALSETVKNGLRVDVDIRTEEGRKEYSEALINLLNNPEEQAEIRTRMMNFAKDYFSWKNVALLWDEKLRIGLQNPEIKYEPRQDTETEITGRTDQSTGATGSIVPVISRGKSGDK